MNFDLSLVTIEPVERLQSVMDEYVYLNEALVFRESMELGPWAVRPVVGRVKPLPGRWDCRTSCLRQRVRGRSEEPRVGTVVR